MMILVSGGSASGKSAFAEQKILEESGSPRYYLATMEVYDAESRRRVEKHRQMRAEKDFTTVECQTHLENVSLPEGSSVLLECLSNLAANEMFSEDGRGENAGDVILDGIRALWEKAGRLVIVTNDVFSDGQIYDASTERYRALLGRLNQETAAMADEVYDVIFGIPVRLK